MFRCYFIENGRISWGDDLTVPTLAEAIELAQDLRQASLKSSQSPGIEIWQGPSLLYQDVHDADQIQSSAPIVSPFETPESTIYATWRPSQARPLMAQVRDFAWLAEVLYRIADRILAPRLFYQTGVAVLIWPVSRSQPTATVFTAKGTFSTLLTGVPEELRELVNLGRYRACYSSGYVTVLF